MRMTALLAATLIFSVLFHTTATAQVIQPSGGEVFTTKIGPWFISHNTYQDGTRICWATNLNYGRRNPIFSFTSATGSEEAGSVFRFDQKNTAKNGDAVELIIGTDTLMLFHPDNTRHGGFFPLTYPEIGKVVNLLLAREKSKRKFFFVRDNRGRKFKFDARSTAKALTYLEDNCGFERG